MTENDPQRIQTPDPLPAGTILPSIQVVAKNFAEDSDNKMHSDETAAEYGFKGGLVPGVGVYAYMTMPVVTALGRDWLERGTMWGKFLKPVYHGETVTVEASVKTSEPLLVEMRVLSEEGILCAVGEAGLTDKAESTIDPVDYPRGALPEKEHRIEPDIALLPSGKVLGSLEISPALPDFRGETGELFVDEMVDSQAIYRGADALLHPAFLPSQANRILAGNVALGPWIHTESRVCHIATARDGESISTRGKVLEAYEKRGHEFAVLDVALFGESDRPLARVIHTSIIRPALKTV